MENVPFQVKKNLTAGERKPDRQESCQQFACNVCANFLAWLLLRIPARKANFIQKLFLNNVVFGMVFEYCVGGDFRGAIS